MSRQPPELRGVCPNCEMHHGVIGEACPEPACARKNYRFIPNDWHKNAKEFANRKRRPLDPMLGRLLDRYLVAGKLGEGGMGAVYLALQMPLNREVALKVIAGLELDDQTIARFEREARAISVLDHPNIVKLHDYGVGEIEFQIPYMALEYVKRGRTLRSALAHIRQENDGAPIPGETILVVFAQILNALGTAHQIGIVHRDIKPDNVMLAPVLGNPYHVKVLDFGLAKAVSDVTGFDNNVSRTGQFLGTPYYMAPEQAMSASAGHEVDGRADLYAVAVMLFEIFTGVKPFDGETPLEVVTRKVDPEFSPMKLPQAEQLPNELKMFLERGMAKNPDDRFTTASTMLKALEDVLRDGGVTALGLAEGTSGSSTDQPDTPPTVDLDGPTEYLIHESTKVIALNATESLEPTRLMADSANHGAKDRPVVSDVSGAGKKSIWPWLLVSLVAVAVAVGVFFVMSNKDGDQVAATDDLGVMVGDNQGGSATTTERTPDSGSVPAGASGTKVQDSGTASSGIVETKVESVAGPSKEPPAESADTHVKEGEKAGGLPAVEPDEKKQEKSEIDNGRGKTLKPQKVSTERPKEKDSGSTNMLDPRDIGRKIKMPKMDGIDGIKMPNMPSFD